MRRAHSKVAIPFVLCCALASACTDRDPATAPEARALLLPPPPSGLGPKPMLINPYVRLTGSIHSTCGIKQSGAADCWGTELYGETGNQGAILAGATFADIDQGSYHTCAIDKQGYAWCWGSNSMGQLGIGPYPAIPGEVMGVADAHVFKNISAGDQHSCAVDVNGAAWCWGQAGYGKLGTGQLNIAEQRSPVQVQAPAGVVFQSISAGTNHTCAVSTTHRAYCWGLNYSGEVGNGSAEDTFAAPQEVAGNLSFSSVSAGKGFTCGVTTTGEAYCWGNGPLGSGTMTYTSSRTPVVVDGGLTFSSLSAGGWHVCGVTTSKAGYCWGDNNHGQLGTQAYIWSSPTPRLVASVSFSRIDVGFHHSCGVTAAGDAIYCWGENGSRQLGDGTTTDRYLPVAGPTW